MIVGVNRFTVEDEPETDILSIDPAQAAARLAGALRPTATTPTSRRSTTSGRGAGTENLLPRCGRAGGPCTLGEVSDVADVFGVYHPGR